MTVYLQNRLSGVQPTALTDHMIMRKSITFGPEVSIAEKLAHKTLHNRGLSFVCYQSNLANGFEFVQEGKCARSCPKFPCANIDCVSCDSLGRQRELRTSEARRARL